MTPAGRPEESRLPPPLAPEWRAASPPDPETVTRLEEALGLPRALCALLVVRGFTEPGPSKRFLRPLIADLHPPGLMTDADVAADRIEAAIRDGETVFVHGDYDVDGVSATALLTRWLRRLGAIVVPFVPHRIRDGYDLGETGITRAVASGASLLITVDSGIVAHDAVDRAVASGLDVIVTDHHTPGATLPAALAVVNPNRSDCAYPDKNLSGAGVAFKICQLLGARRGVPEDDLLSLLDLVALATVADLMPLVGENRILVRYGLRALAATDKPGLRALREATGLKRPEVTAGQVGFVLAPRINAVGRMGDADQALKLLLTDDDDEARALAAQLEEENHRRREEDRRTLDEALEQLAASFDPEEDFGLVIAGEGWHPGVIGIVASRVVDRLHRPTVLVALDGDMGRGSARSIRGLDLYATIAACATHLDRFGGHAQAAGMDLRREHLDAFRDQFNREVRERLEGALPPPGIRIDLDLELSGASAEAVHYLAYAGPFGQGNPQPTFVARNLSLSGAAREVGDGHLKLRFQQDGAQLDAIGFRMVDRIPPRSLDGKLLEAVFILEENEYRGRVSVQARLLDVRVQEDDEP